jgi:acyl-CoA dehydrogenase
MKWIGKGRYLIPSRALGIAERLLGMAIEHANTRETFGSRSAATRPSSG